MASRSTTIREGGTLVLPDDLLRELGVRDGDTVILEVVQRKVTDGYRAVGGQGRGGRAHRRCHRGTSNQGDLLRYPARDHHRLIKTPPPTTEGVGWKTRVPKNNPLGNYLKFKLSW